jgi:hypothetical protein
MVLTSYATNAQFFGEVDINNNLTKWEAKNRIPTSIPDGMSNTIMFTERYGRCGNFPNGTKGGNAAMWWGYDYAQPTIAVWAISTMPNSNTIPPSNTIFQIQPTPWEQGGTGCDPLRASSAHSGLIMALLGDGSVRTISSGTTPASWWAAITAGRGETLQLD